MSDLISLLSRHGYAIVAALVFAAVGGHVLRAPILLPLALGAMLLGDTLLFLAGKWTGWTLLGFLCKVSANPETCILRSAESFYKRGKTTLVIAKFIPGVNTMGPPLAGSMKMPFSQFVRYDALGAALYILAYFTLGFLGRDFLKAIGSTFQTAGHAIEEVLLLGLIVYAAYRIWLVRKNRVYRIVPRVQVQELIARLASEEADKVLLVDVRSHGYYDADTARIKGSIRIEPNNLEAELKKLPPGRDVYLYCT
jgi:membrane protein DedA with SNARE-associated domain